jgi:ankyrin repeat protein
LLEVKPIINISIWNNAFREVYENGNLKLAKFLLEVKPTIDVFANDECAFCMACQNGLLEIIDNEEVFRWACEEGYLEVAKWLLEVNPDIDISAKDDLAFRTACEEGHLEVAKWLQSLFPERYHI